MHRYKVELLPAAWTELDEIADLHLQLVGPNRKLNLKNHLTFRRICGIML